MFDFIPKELFAVCLAFGFLWAMIFDWPDILKRYFGEKEDDEE